MEKQNKSEKKRKRFGIFFKILIILFIVSLFPVVTSTFLTIATYQEIIRKYLPQEEMVTEVLFLTQQNVKIQAFLITFLVIVLTIFAAILMSRHFFQPIKRLLRGTKEVSAGNLDFQIKITSDDELGELSRAFNQMIKDLKKFHSSLEETKASLEIKVGARTKELRELADSLEKQVKERTKELQERIKELERFHRLTVGRELKMIELKEEIKKLKRVGERISQKSKNK